MGEVTRAPGPGLLKFLWGVRRLGFLAEVSALWREHGDVFQVGSGAKTLLFAMHPEHVKYVNVSRRDNYDKGATYDDVRDYISGAGLVASTGEIWRRQRKLMAPFFTPARPRSAHASTISATVRPAPMNRCVVPSGMRVKDISSKPWDTSITTPRMPPSRTIKLLPPEKTNVGTSVPEMIRIRRCNRAICRGRTKMSAGPPTRKLMRSDIGALRTASSPNSSSMRL